MSNLYQESIADAKALKDLATENAKHMLSESFSEKLDDMVTKLLKEEYSDDDEKSKKMDSKKKDDKMDETSYAKDGKDGLPANKTPQPGEERDVKDGDKKEGKNESAESAEDALDTFLETVDQELSGMREGKEKKEDEDEDEMEEAVDSSDIGKGDNKMPSPKSDRNNTEDPQKGFFESLSREDLMSIVMEALEEVSEGKDGWDDDKKEKPFKKDKKYDMGGKGKDMKEMESKIDSLESELAEAQNKLSSTQEQLEEAENVINRLSSTINEANLLNSKLLHVNKLNNEFDLNEGQKEKILNKINEGENIKEVKLIYSVLQESFNEGNIKKKGTINEGSAGTASGVVGSTAPSKKTVNEGVNTNKNRWQILAGIKSPNILED